MAGAGVQKCGQGQEAVAGASQEGDCICLRLPAPGCGGLQEDEPSSQGALLCPPQNWQGAADASFCYLTAQRMHAHHGLLNILH